VQLRTLIAMEQPTASRTDVVSHNEFFEDKHIKYIKQVAADTKSFGFIVSQHLRMSGIYWGLTSLSVLGIDIIEEMDTASIVDWVMTCQDDSGG
jgi:geranylgeranyl transferase type-2 subunit beta